MAVKLTAKDFSAIEFFYAYNFFASVVDLEFQVLCLSSLTYAMVEIDSDSSTVCMFRWRY